MSAEDAIVRRRVRIITDRQITVVIPIEQGNGRVFENLGKPASQQRCKYDQARTLNQTGTKVVMTVFVNVQFALTHFRAISKNSV